MEEVAKGTLDELSREECLRLLANREFGRVAVNDDGQPVIFPVNYALDGELVVFRTDPGSKLDHAALDRVSFEVDEVDIEGHEGWSVVVTGTARELTDAMDETSVRELEMPIQPWVRGPKAHWVRIVPSQITGRRLRNSSE